MESLAEPGTIWVTEDTFKLTEGLFRFEALGEKEVKGKDKPVKVYRVIARSSRRTRFDVSAERGLTPFVGRERELELLLDGFGRARDGMGQVYSIVGEAGVGKSRFLYEFRKAVSNENMTFLKGKCLSYGKATPYHPIVDILKANFEISEDDEDAKIRDKVTSGLKVLDVDEASTLPYLLELLSVKDSGIDKIQMSPEGRKMKIIEALIRIVIKGAEFRPLILAVEDLHWMDKSSEEAFKCLLEAIPGVRVMLVFTFRPEYSQPWGTRSFHNQINLNRLSNRESVVMVSPLLGTGDIDPGLQKLIVSKTEGVPFFIEEFVKSLQDLKAIRREDGKVFLEGHLQSSAVPSTIQDMIMARVDRLPDPAKAVLQAGSVIEREFTYQLISKVTSLPESELTSHLTALKDSELLYERGIYPRTSYIFRHALTREVVYNSVLTQRRKDLHEASGRAMEDLNKEELPEHYEALALHYVNSENYEKAAEFSKRAAGKAEKAASFPVAIAFSNQQISCLEKMPRTEAITKKIIDARTAYALYLAQLNHFFEAGEAVHPISDSAIKLNYKRRICQIRTIQGTFHFNVEEDFPRAYRAFEEALRISEEVKDIVTSVLASFWFGCALGQDCEFEKAAHHLKKAVDINSAVNNLWGIAAMKANLALCCYLYSGNIGTGFRISNEAVRIAEESSDTYSRGMTYSIHGSACYAKGLIEDAIRHSSTGAELCEKINLHSYAMLANFRLGEIYCETGDFPKSRKYYEKAISTLKGNRQFPSWLRVSRIGPARSELMETGKEVDLESIFRDAKHNKIRMAEGHFSRHIGQILLTINDRPISETGFWIQKAIEDDKRNGTFFDLGRSYALYAEFFKRQGDRTKAQDNLGEAIDILRKCGADGWVEKYKRELAIIQ
jgi:predicted ATPase